MIKPTAQQLKLLYPDINTNYISDYIDRQLVLIDIEQQNIYKVDAIMNAYMQRAVGLINIVFDDNSINDYSKQNKIIELLTSLVAELKTELCNIQVFGMLSMYETSSTLYKWILEKYFCDNVYYEYGGEQKKTTVKVTKKKFSKQKASDLMNTKIYGNPLGINMDNYLDVILQSVKPFNQIKNNIKKAFNTSTNNIKRDTAYAQQVIAYESMNDVEFKADGFENVYYRIEVLDANICLLCMSADGKVNDKPLGRIHNNCRGIDILLLKDKNGKYYDINLAGYGHKMKTQTLEKKFANLSNKQQCRMLGKTNYEYYSNGQLTINDFLNYNRQITKREADIKVSLNNIKNKIQTPNMATRIVNCLDKLFTKNISEMDNEELLAYEKILGYQRQLYSFVPSINYGATTLQDYLNKIDKKYDKIQTRREILKGGDN